VLDEGSIIALSFQIVRLSEIAKLPNCRVGGIEIVVGSPRAVHPRGSGSLCVACRTCIESQGVVYGDHDDGRSQRDPVPLRLEDVLEGHVHQAPAHGQGRGHPPPAIYPTINALRK